MERSKLMGICVNALRKNAGLTIKEFAEKVGYTPQAVGFFARQPLKPIPLRFERVIREAFDLDDEGIDELIRIATTRPPISQKVRTVFAWVDDIYVHDEMSPFIESVAPLLDSAPDVMDRQLQYEISAKRWNRAKR